MLEKSIKDQITLKKFAEWFENWFYNNSDYIQKEITNKEIFNSLEELYNDIGYFEPNSELRKEHSSYFGENELKVKIEQIFEILQNSK